MACAKKGVAFFFKQWGGTRKKKTGRFLDGRTWEEYPSSMPAPSEGQAALIPERVGAREKILAA